MEDLLTDEVCFDELYEHYFRRVYHISLNITKDIFLAEDVTQETFIKAYKKITMIHDRAKIGAWLSTIATNTAIDMIRKEKKKTFIPIDDLFYTDQESRLPLLQVDKEIEWGIKQAELNQELVHLSPKLRKVFLLKYKKDLNDEEIARELRITISAVKTRAYRARKIVQEKMKKREQEALIGA